MGKVLSSISTRYSIITCPEWFGGPSENRNSKIPVICIAVPCDFFSFSDFAENHSWWLPKIERLNFVISFALQGWHLCMIIVRIMELALQKRKQVKTRVYVKGKRVESKTEIVFLGGTRTFKTWIAVWRLYRNQSF